MSKPKVLTDEGKISNPEGRILLSKLLLMQSHFLEKENGFNGKNLLTEEVFSVFTHLSKSAIIFLFIIKKRYGE